MWFTVENVDTRVSKHTEEEAAWLDHFLGFPDPSARFRYRSRGDGRRAMLNAFAMTFPTGLLDVVRAGAKEAGMKVELLDLRKPPCPPDPAADLGWLFDYQEEAVEVGAQKHRGVFHCPTGCHRAGTRVRMFDGTVSAVEDVRVGDVLMGPYSEPCVVRQLCRGMGAMYEVRPTKGTSFYCNLGHVLTLVRTDTGRVVDVPLREWLGWSETQKHLHKLFRVGVRYPVRDLPIDPHFFGVLLGDGTLRGRVGVTTEDPELVSEVHAQARRWGLSVYQDGDPAERCPTYLLTAGRRGPRIGRNALRNALDALGLAGRGSGDKFIPVEYLRAGWGQRMELLAGLLDSDGSLANGYYDYVTKSQALADGVVELARSLGLAAYVRRCRKRCQTGATGDYWRVGISGDLARVPCRLPRKVAARRRQRKDALRTGFTVRRVAAAEDYYGFTLDGYGRYLLEDFTVTHNSGKTEVLVALALVYKCPWGVFVPSKSLLNQTRDRFNERAGGEAAGVIGDGVWNPQRVTVATFQTVYRGLCAREPRVMAWLDSLRGVTGDEIHTVAADSFWQTFGACRKAHFRFGTSATPFARTDRKGLLVMAATGPTIYRIAPAVLVAKGAIARPRVRLAAFAHAHREMAALRAARATYGEAYEAAIAASPARLAASLRLVAQAAKPTLVFVRALEHGQTLTRALAKAGTAAEFVWGAKNTPQREAAVRRLVHGDIDVLVANVVFQVGVDIPELMSVVNLAGGKSHIAALQQAGRGSRRRDRRGDVVKDQFEVWDLADKGCGCRAPGTQSYTHAACRWFEAHTRARKRAYLGEGYEVVEV